LAGSGAQAIYAKPRGQRVAADERLPNRLFRHAKCEGTIEDHRPIALDVRELIRKHVFDQSVPSVFRPNIAFQWLRLMRLNSSSLELQLSPVAPSSCPWCRQAAA
jgi:hypothetical protein